MDTSLLWLRCSIGDEFIGAPLLVLSSIGDEFNMIIKHVQGCALRKMKGSLVFICAHLSPVTSGVPNIGFLLKKLRFSSRLRCQGPPGTARAQP